MKNLLVTTRHLLKTHQPLPWTGTNIFKSQHLDTKKEAIWKEKQKPNRTSWNQDGDESDLQQTLSLVLRCFYSGCVLNDTSMGGHGQRLHTKKRQQRGGTPFPGKPWFFPRKLIHMPPHQYSYSSPRNPYSFKANPSSGLWPNWGSAQPTWVTLSSILWLFYCG